MRVTYKRIDKNAYNAALKEYSDWKTGCVISSKPVKKSHEKDFGRESVVATVLHQLPNNEIPSFIVEEDNTHQIQIVPMVWCRVVHGNEKWGMNNYGYMEMSSSSDDNESD